MFKFDNKIWYSKYQKIVDPEIGSLIFLHGLPRSGKSTLASQWLHESSMFKTPKVLITGDDFRLATYGQEYDRSCEFASALTTFTAIKALLKNHCVLFDETNSSEWSLRRIFEICPTAQYIDIGTEKKICLERNAKSRNILPFVFDRIERQLLEIDPEDIRKDYI